MLVVRHTAPPPTSNGASSVAATRLRELGAVGRRARGVARGGDEELVAALAGHRTVAGDRGQPARDLAQDLVPGAVAEAVVDEPELVDADRQQRGAGGAVHPVAQARRQGRPGQQPGQRVLGAALSELAHLSP